jgi:hypothetical protein
MRRQTGESPIGCMAWLWSLVTKEKALRNLVESYFEAREARRGLDSAVSYSNLLKLERKDAIMPDM